MDFLEAAGIEARFLRPRDDSSKVFVFRLLEEFQHESSFGTFDSMS